MSSPFTATELRIHLAEADENLIENFIVYHQNNPHVFEAFSEAANEVWNAGKRKYSARTLMEVIRWRRDNSTESRFFKISNNSVPLYARLLEVTQPQFVGFFSKKVLRPHQSDAYSEIEGFTRKVGNP